MSNIVNFNIVSGTIPFEVELIGSTIPIQTFNSLGVHSINNVPNGVYTLKITDGNGCEFEREIIVDPFVTTTTTTIIPGNFIVVGQAQDPLIIFNPAGTNKNGNYVGYPDPDIVPLYLWFKTFDGKPLVNSIVLNYNIGITGGTADSQFEFNSLSDEVHAEVQESVTGPANTILGSIILKPGFIETFFEYTYYRGSVNMRYQIEIISTAEKLYPNSETKNDAGTTYGISSIDVGSVILDY